MDDLQLLERLKKKGADRPCEACGNEEFDVYIDEEGNAATFWMASKGTLGFHVYMVSCVNCGATRSFDARKINRPLEGDSQ